MNKIIRSIKNILLLMNIILLGIFYHKFYFIPNINYFIYTVLLGFTIFITVKDGINKNTIQKNSKYNVLFLVVELFINFILIRTLFDLKFIYNSSDHMNIIINIDKNYSFDQYKLMNVWYLQQNLWYFNIMYLALIIYRRINTDNIKESKYSRVTLLCLLLSIGTTIPTLETFHIDTIPIGYLMFNLILLTIEIIELKRNNGKKREWPIYICFFFNMFAFISIFT